MRYFIVLVLTLLAVNANAAILVFSPNGTYTTKPDLATAATSADAVGKTIVVTSALSAVQSNISSATLHRWPSDRALEVRKGGSINPTTLFKFSDGAIKEVTPEMFGANGISDDIAINKAFAALPDSGGTVRLLPKTYTITASINPRTGSQLIGEFGEPLIPSQTTTGTGTRILWNGGTIGNIINVNSVRLFRMSGIQLDGNNQPNVTGILLTTTNNTPSGSQCSFEFITIQNCLVGVQWGTLGLSTPNDQNDGIIFRQGTITSTVPNSIGFILNSGNAAQYSSIENFGINVDSVGIDIVVANQLQIRKVVTGGKVALAAFRLSTAINVLIEGCESENQADLYGGSGKISFNSKFIWVVAPQNGYPVDNTTIVLTQNTINNPIQIDYPVKIVSTGDAWAATCYSGVSLVPVTGTFTNGTSSLLALNNGYGGTESGWIAGQYVQMQDFQPKYGEGIRIKHSSPAGYAQILEPTTASASNDFTTAIDSRAFTGKLWEFITAGVSSTSGANGDYIFKRDGTTNILKLSTTAVTIGNPSTAVPLILLNSTSTSYADNAAAVAAGLTNGTVYRNGDLLQIVHP